MWQRVFSESLLDKDISWELLDAPPDGEAVFLGDTMTGYIWRSLDGGQLWGLQKTLSPAGPPGAWLITGIGSLLLAGDTEDEVYYSENNGFSWETQAISDIGRITSLAQADNGDLLASGIDDEGAAWIARRLEGAAVWKTLDEPVPLDEAEWVLVAFAYDYADTGRVVATGVDDDDDAGLWSWTFGASDDWLRLDADTYGSDDATVSIASGLLAAPGVGNEDEGYGMLYVADSRTSDGLTRVRGSMETSELLKAPVSPSGLYFSGVWASPAQVGNVTLYTISEDAYGEAGIYTYSDGLNTSGTVTYSSLTESSVSINWSALSKATRYRVFITEGQALDSLYTGAVADYTGARTYLDADSLLPDTEYYVSVWADSPVSSFRYGVISFITPPSVPTYSTHFSPIHGAYSVPVKVNFAWDPPSEINVTGYQLEYGTSPDFEGAYKVNLPSDQSYYTPLAALKYGTTYYWRVATVGAGGISVFVASVFTTEDALPVPVTTVLPPPSTPTITVSLPQPTIEVEAPQGIVTMPARTTTMPTPTYILPQSETPLYMWMIVGIVGGSALLTPLLIVLTLRSRRE